MKKGKKLYGAIAGGLCIVFVAGCVGWHFVSATGAKKKNPYREVSLEHGNLPLTFTAEGVTADGDTVQKPVFDVTEVDFVIEEAYVKKEEEIKKGDALYKISSESIKEAISYYEEAVAKASKEKERTKAAYESGKSEAEYIKTEKKSTAASAQEVYDAANDTLEQKVTEAEATLNEARNQIRVYQSNLEQNTYYSDAGVKSKKETFNQAEKSESKAKENFKQAKEEYNTAAEDVNSQIAVLQKSVSAESTDMELLAKQIAELSKKNQTLAEKKKAFSEAEAAYQTAEAEAAKAKEEYHAANTAYEKSVSDATARKETLEASISSLEQAYTMALNAQTTGKADNQNTYDTAVLEGEYADTTYESTVSSLKNAYDTAAENLAELKEEQSALLALKDGVITAAQDGVLSGVFYETGDIIRSDMGLVSYADTEKLTIAVEVSQENISKTAVGDAVSVSLPKMRRDDIEGTITTVASQATSGGSMSNVTYTVEVSIDNTDGTISTESSAYVTFSYGEIEDADYILTKALDKIEGTTAVVKAYNTQGEIEEIPVTIGESLEQYTVITEGITEDIRCLIEVGGRNDEQEQEAR